MNFKRMSILGAAIGVFFAVAVLIFSEIYGVWFIRVTPSVDLRILLWPASEWLMGAWRLSVYGIAKTLVLVAMNAVLYAAFAVSAYWIARRIGRLFL